MYERAALMALFQAGAHPAYRELERAVRSLERGGSALAASMPTRAAALRMMAMVAAGASPVHVSRARAKREPCPRVTGFQPSAQLWWSTVHSTARCESQTTNVTAAARPRRMAPCRCVSSPHLRLLLAVLCSPEGDKAGVSGVGTLESSVMLQHVLLESVITEISPRLLEEIRRRGLTIHASDLIVSP